MPRRVLVLTSEYPPHTWGGLGRHSAEMVAGLRKHVSVDVINVPSYTQQYDPSFDGLPADGGDTDDGGGRTLHLPAPRRGDSWAVSNDGVVGHRTRTALGGRLGPRYDVLLAQDCLVAPLAAQLLHARIGSGLVSFCHLPLYAGFSYFDRPAEVDQQHVDESLLFRLSQRVVVPSHFTRQVVLQSYGLAPDQVVVVPEGVHLAPADTPRQYEHREGPVRLVTVGRLTKQKGVHYMVDLAEELHRRTLDFEYTIVGRGPLDGYLTERLSTSPARLRVRHLRSVDPDRGIFDLYRQSDVLVSVSLYETFGLTVLEAMANGCVPLAFDVGAVPELVQPGSGFLIPVGDVAAMADRIGDVAADPAGTGPIVAHNREVAGTMTWSRHADELLDVLEALW